MLKLLTSLKSKQCKGPFTQAIFTAISKRDYATCKLLAIPQRFESPVVYTGDLKSRLKLQQKSQQKSPV